MLLMESALVVGCLLLAFVFPRSSSSFFSPVERGLANLARHPHSAVLVVGASALALRTAALPILPVPYPGVHDEFSYQLMADTFAHGRLTNPTHPLWIHFENVSVIHQPTYCSVYYPAQGIFMALGQLVTGDSFWGVWLSIGLMCAAICWMLQAWVAPFWALIGGLLAAVRIATFSYWANSYFGGAVAAIGGALVLGALPRIRRQPSVTNALLMGLGFAILANSRPFETAFFGVPVILVLAYWIFRNDENRRTILLRTALPLALVLTVTAGFLLYYFWRTTGNPFLPAYIVNLRRYTVEPSFPWLPLRPIPQYHHEILRRYFLGYNMSMFQLARAHPVFSIIIKVLMLWFFFLGPLLTLPVLGLGFVLPYGMSLKDLSKRTRLLLIVCAATLLAVLLPVYANPHYAAPITAAIYALLMIAFQRIRHWRFRGKPSGIALIRAALGGAVALVLLRVALPVFHLSLVNSNKPETWCSPWYQLLPREAVERQLQADAGDHLVLVHYSPEHDPTEDWAWVNNAADIDRSKIVWAHDMGPQNDELLRYFTNRHIWLLEPDQNPIHLAPCDAACTTSLATQHEVPK
jgi:hypothetical protein